jgi:hypothetical protein
MVKELENMPLKEIITKGKTGSSNNGVEGSGGITEVGKEMHDKMSKFKKQFN